MKMETDESPDPGHSPPGSSSSSASGSPELSTNLSNYGNTTTIFTPPQAFADSSASNSPASSASSTPQRKARNPGSPILSAALRKYRTPIPQVQGNSPSRILFGELTLTVPTKGSTDVAVQGKLQKLGFLNVNGELAHAHNVVPVCASSRKPVVANHHLLNVLAASSCVSSSTTSTMAATTKSMLNSTFALNSTFTLPNSSDVGHISGKERTPTLLITDSVLGNSTFGVLGNSTLAALVNNSNAWATQTPPNTSLPNFVTTRPKLQPNDRNTPIILASASVLGDSPMRIPDEHEHDKSPVSAQSSFNELQHTPASLAKNHTWSIQNEESTEDSASVVESTQTLAVMMPANIPVTEHISFSDNELAAHLLTIAEETSQDMTSSEPMDVTPALDQRDLRGDLQNVRAEVNHIKTREHELKEELHGIKGKFFSILDNLGLSRDVYFNALTPAETPQSNGLHDINSNNLSAIMASQSQFNRNAQGSIPNSPCVMTSPNQSTPRRAGPSRGRQRGVPHVSRTMYAELLIQQLLAQAQADSSSPDSSKSDSPLEPQAGGGDDVGAQGAEAATVSKLAPLHDTVPTSHSHTVHINRGTPRQGSRKSADRPVVTSDAVCSVLPAEGDGSATTLLAPIPFSLADDSVASAAVSNDSNSTSSSSGLRKDLMSRFQYYSDFTVDRQKKIDDAGVMPDSSKEESPPTASDNSSSASNKSMERLSQRCVEGCESSPELLIPNLPPRVTVNRTGCNPSNSRRTNRSRDVGEPSSSSRHSSRYSDRLSRHSSGSSSHGSCSSRTTSHPLASSTLISDPSYSGSQKSGSLYMWSLSNTSDEDVENLHKSFLRSNEKRQQRKSRRSRDTRRLTTSRSSHSPSSSRPVTLIGADSPPDQKAGDGGGTNSTLHLTHMLSVIEDSLDPRHFGGHSYENSALPSPRSRSLPRTSTRIGLLAFDSRVSNHKSSSTPEVNSHTRRRDSNIYVTHHAQQRMYVYPSSGIPERPEILGQSHSTSGSSRKSAATCGSVTSYNSNCSQCNPTKHMVSPSSTHRKRLVQNGHEGDDEDALVDDILTNSPCSYSSSGVHPPYNSYTSPVDSGAEYITVSESSPEREGAAASRTTRIVKSPGGGAVFKVPFSPPSRTLKRKTSSSTKTRSVGVKTVGSPHLPTGLIKHSEPLTRRKLFYGAAAAVTASHSISMATRHNSSGTFHAPKVSDKKSLARRIKKFTTTFRKNKDKNTSSSTSTIRTLANL